MKGFLPVAIRFAKRRAGLRQHHRAGNVRIVRQQLLNDHAADRMSDQNGPDRAGLRQEILQGHRPDAAMLTAGSGADPP